MESIRMFFSWLKSFPIHVWYIYLPLGDFYGKLEGKFTSSQYN